MPSAPDEPLVTAAPVIDDDKPEPPELFAPPPASPLELLPASPTVPCVGVANVWTPEISVTFFLPPPPEPTVPELGVLVVL